MDCKGTLLLSDRYLREQALQLGRDIERSILTMPVTLYDQFGRPVPNTESTVGVRRKYKFTARP